MKTIPIDHDYNPTTANSWGSWPESTNVGSMGKAPIAELYQNSKGEWFNFVRQLPAHVPAEKLPGKAASTVESPFVTLFESRAEMLAWVKERDDLRNSWL